MTSRINYNNPAANKLGLSYHYEMVSDKLRVEPFKKAIKQACQGNRVLESGTGSGIMSILAAKAGATRVYATEIDPEIAKFAQNNINKNNLQNIIKIIHKDTRTLTVDDLEGEKVDVVIAENLSTWMVNEPQIQILNHINKFLIKDKGIRIPEVVYNNLELAESEFSFEGIELRAYFFEFSGVKRPKLLSKKTLFSEVDLSKINPENVDFSIKIEVKEDGLLNSLKLTSPIKVHGDISFSQSDSLMPPVIVPLKEDILVSKGDIVTIHIKYGYTTDWTKFSVIAHK